ncbi:methyltransferase domain-containing protein [Microbacterium sp. cf332]|uniref:methyltransferase domain-containing protein n=1 Tax=Microbacterium sp. cf332 TaxID=1761804 RepID=UPI00088260D2|nr:methyltransferase domain-containing protein [Microbacterium sp. cf332]SDQ65602.1 2-polyprenyl-3-methyl-5-hydroxy-6-metoxy-1,4-benzoquinol methylase [Microbacterium sp. cf332]
MDLRHRDVALRELMDDPACDPAALARTLRRFDVVNRAVSGWGTVWRRRLRPVLARLDRPARVLDIGSGGGDVTARLARLAERDGLSVTWLGIDPDPRALAVARERARPDVEFRSTDSTALRATGERFDAVISNHVLHHLGEPELGAFLADSLALSSGIVLHADIERGRTAYALYAAGILPLQRGTFLRTDGLRSIRRSYRAPELRATLAGHGEWHVVRPAPFRVLAMGRGRG